MSLDRSLKSAGSLVRHRNVLTRAERLDKLKEAEKWDESKTVFGLPKVEHRKVVIAKAAKEEAAPAAAEGAAAGAAGTPAAGAGAPAAGAAAAPAKGAAAGGKAAAGAAAPAGKAAAAPAAKGKK